MSQHYYSYQRTDFSYVTNGDPSLRHEGVLGSGGYGDVHKVVTLLSIAHNDIDLQA